MAAGALSALTHGWSWVHSEQRCSIWLAAPCTQPGITGKQSAAAPTSQMDFTHYHANVSGLGPLGRGSDLEGEASFTLLPSHESTQTKANDSIYSSPSNPATSDGEKNGFCRGKAVSEPPNRWKTELSVISRHRVSVKTDLSSNIKYWKRFFCCYKQLCCQYLFGAGLFYSLWRVSIARWHFAKSELVHISPRTAFSQDKLEGNQCRLTFLR